MLLVSDLQAVYQYDVLEVLLDPTPSRVMVAKLLVERLQVDTHRSLYRCIDVLKKPELYGWDKDSQFRAAQIDAINLNTTMTVRSAMEGQKDFPLWPPVPTPYAADSKDKKPKDDAPAEKPKLPELTPENTFSLADAERLFSKN
jgi:hypothetical protein